MATVTHYIYSHHKKDQGDREEKREVVVEDDSADPWQTESSFSVQRRLTTAPRFIRAEVPYEGPYDTNGTSTQSSSESQSEGGSNEVSSWYRTLTRQSMSMPMPIAQPRPLTAPPPNSTSHRDSKSTLHKDQWFISRALRSELSSNPSSPQSTLADILAREPPPMSPKDAVKPPVFLALGPANKGWTMLQQQGWNEGEGIGATAPRRTPLASLQISPKNRNNESSAEWLRINVKREEQQIKCDSDGEIQELRHVEVVDLTMSDSGDEGEPTTPGSEPSASTLSSHEPMQSHTTPILTPIPTILKSDRLGIGLKAKTVGPYKASKKRVTHNKAALAAHIHANDETRRMKALVGRGSRGFARLAKVESEQRRKLLASLNAD